MIHIYQAAGFYQTSAPEFLPDVRQWFADSSFNPTLQYGFNTTLVDHSKVQGENEGLKGLESAQPFLRFLEAQGEECLRELGFKVKYPLRVKNAWMNEMRAGETHPMHSHYGHILSGTYYVDMPPECAGIAFDSGLRHQHRYLLEVESYNPFNSIFTQTRPNPGDLLIWPAYVLHEVQASKFEGVRRSLAFDLGY